MDYSWVEWQLGDKAKVLRSTIQALESHATTYTLTGHLAAAVLSDATFGEKVEAEVLRDDIPVVGAALAGFDVTPDGSGVQVASARSRVRFMLHAVERVPSSLPAQFCGEPCHVPAPPALFDALLQSQSQERGVQRMITNVALAALAEQYRELEPQLPRECRFE